MLYDNFDVDLFCDVYVKEKHVDPHAVFAERLGISRQDAKVLCHRIAYNTTFGKMVRDSLKK